MGALVYDKLAEQSSTVQIVIALGIHLRAT